MASAICASFVTSQIDEYATPPAARISSQTSEASLMSRISIFAPSAARRTAAARPSPAAAPETTAIRSFKRLILFPLPRSASWERRHPSLRHWFCHKLEDALRPGGTLDISRWRNHRKRANKIPRAQDGALDLNSPEILLVIFHTALLQKFQILFLKRLFAMMLFLIGNVIFHRPYLRSADSECAIPFLPGEQRLLEFIMNPSRG